MSCFVILTEINDLFDYKVIDVSATCW